MDNLNLELGKVIVKNLREESFGNFDRLLKYAESTSYEAYMKLPKNSHIDDKLQLNMDSYMKFLCSLDKDQKEQLRRLILKILDDTVFIFLREVDENQIDNKGIGLTFNGKTSNEISKKLLSGTLFGEYFLWVEKFSEFGSVQEYQ